jgi:hypothetical protein
MTRNITELEEKMVIKKDNFKPITTALTTFAKPKLKNKPYYSVVLAENVKVTDKNAANIYFGQEITETNDLITILENMMFEPEFNKNGDLTIMRYVGESLYNAFEEFFDIVAPFVEPGSHISFEGENQEFFQYAFDGKTMREKAGTITWED